MTSTIRNMKTGLFMEVRPHPFFPAEGFIIFLLKNQSLRMRMNSVRRLETALPAGEQRAMRRASEMTEMRPILWASFCGQVLITSVSQHLMRQRTAILDRSIRQAFPRMLFISFSRSGQTITRILWSMFSPIGILGKGRTLMYRYARMLLL